MENLQKRNGSFDSNFLTKVATFWKVAQNMAIVVRKSSKKSDFRTTIAIFSKNLLFLQKHTS